MSETSLHLKTFEGGDALPAYRRQALLARLQAVVPRISGLSARFVHWVAVDAEPLRADLDAVEALL